MPLTTPFPLTPSPHPLNHLLAPPKRQAKAYKFEDGKLEFPTVTGKLKLPPVSGKLKLTYLSCSRQRQQNVSNVNYKSVCQ